MERITGIDHDRDCDYGVSSFSFFLFGVCFNVLLDIHIYCHVMYDNGVGGGAALGKIL